MAGASASDEFGFGEPSARDEVGDRDSPELSFDLPVPPPGSGLAEMSDGAADDDLEDAFGFGSEDGSETAAAPDAAASASDAQVTSFSAAPQSVEVKASIGDAASHSVESICSVASDANAGAAARSDADEGLVGSFSPQPPPPSHDRSNAGASPDVEVDAASTPGAFDSAHATRADSDTSAEFGAAAASTSPSCSTPTSSRTPATTPAPTPATTPAPTPAPPPSATLAPSPAATAASSPSPSSTPVVLSTADAEASSPRPDAPSPEHTSEQVSEHFSEQMSEQFSDVALSDVSSAAQLALSDVTSEAVSVGAFTSDFTDISSSSRSFHYTDHSSAFSSSSNGHHGPGDDSNVDSSGIDSSNGHESTDHSPSEETPEGDFPPFDEGFSAQFRQQAVIPDAELHAVREEAEAEAASEVASETAQAPMTVAAAAPRRTSEGDVDL